VNEEGSQMKNIASLNSPNKRLSSSTGAEVSSAQSPADPWMKRDEIGGENSCHSSVLGVCYQGERKGWF